MKKVLRNKEKKFKLTTLGFTLVELLAVIVVLAIVLIIAVPGVLSIINKTKDNALDRQKDMIKEASRLYVTSDNNVTWVGEDTKMTTVTLDTLKTKGYLDQKMMDPKTKKEITCAKTVITKTGSKYDYDVIFCDQVNSSPRLSSNMIPIRYNGSTWVKADYTNQDNNWYDYDNQQWANIATVSESTRDAYKKANIGNEIKMEDINGMYVWIPRFKYKLFNVDGTVSPVGNPNMAGDYLIDIQLEDNSTPKSKGTQNGQWLTHPAFTFGGEELEGFWMAKFDIGYEGATTVEDAQKDEQMSSKVIVKPNVNSWRGITLRNMYTNIQDMKLSGNPFGLDSGTDPHLMKNIEWGAMAYLTNSKYGKTGNKNYAENDKQVKINNNLNYVTGCGADAQDLDPVDTCNQYDTNLGQGASTTGNITGAYDIAGSAWKVVAGVLLSSDQRNVLVGESGFSQEELNHIAFAGKYIDLYSYRTDRYDRDGAHLGDATIEAGPYGIEKSEWYNDYGNFIQDQNNWVWFLRGGRQLNLKGTGSMAYDRDTGAVNVFNAYRNVLL